MMDESRSPHKKKNNLPSLPTNRGQALLETTLALLFLIIPGVFGMSTLFYKSFQRLRCEHSLFEASRDFMDTHAKQTQKNPQKTSFRRGTHGGLIRLTLTPKGIEGTTRCLNEDLKIQFNQPSSYQEKTPGV